MLGIIIVAYKHPERTARFITEQLPRIRREKVVVVVNNGSSAEDCAALAALCGGVACSPEEPMPQQAQTVVVHAAENLGFARGNNLGAEYLLRNRKCEHILFTNDDILLDPGFDISPLLDTLDSDPSVGAAGPAVIGLDGRHQSPHRRIITPYRQIGWMLLGAFRRKKAPAGETPAVPQPGPCYWLSGAFFTMRADDFAAIGGFDDRTFLYAEEPILAEKLGRTGKHMFFNPQVSVIHLEGGSTGDAMPSKALQKILVDSNCIYYRHYLKGGYPKPLVALYKYLAYRAIDRKQ